MTGEIRYEVSPQLKSQIESLFNNLPAAYPQIEFHLAAMSLKFREHAAAVLEPQLNKFLESSRPKTRSDYATLTSMVDHTLTNLGLCVSNDGEPALLTFYNSKVEDEGLIYAMMTRADNKLGHQIISLGKKAPEIKLMASPDNTVDYLQPLRDQVYNVRKR